MTFSRLVSPIGTGAPPKRTVGVQDVPGDEKHEKPLGKQTKNDGKSPFFMGKLTKVWKITIFHGKTHKSMENHHY